MKTFCLFITTLMLTTSVVAQELYSEVSSDDGKKFLLGPITKDLLGQGDYRLWFEQNYEEYETDPNQIAGISKALDKHHVILFLGTWCGDSRREVPRFIKILDQAGFPEERLKIVAVDRREPNVKKSPTGEEWGLQIKRVPTFIFLKDGKEVNRIVESPVETLEEDMLLVLNKKKYQPHYADLMKSE